MLHSFFIKNVFYNLSSSFFLPLQLMILKGHLPAHHCRDIWEQREPASGLLCVMTVS